MGKPRSKVIRGIGPKKGRNRAQEATDQHAEEEGLVLAPTEALEDHVGGDEESEVATRRSNGRAREGVKRRAETAEIGNEVMSPTGDGNSGEMEEVVATEPARKKLPRSLSSDSGTRRTISSPRKLKSATTTSPSNWRRVDDHGNTFLYQPPGGMVASASLNRASPQKAIIFKSGWPNSSRKSAKPFSTELEPQSTPASGDAYLFHSWVPNASSSTSKTGSELISDSSNIEQAAESHPNHNTLFSGSERTITWRQPLHSTVTGSTSIMGLGNSALNGNGDDTALREDDVNSGGHLGTSTMTSASVSMESHSTWQRHIFVPMYEMPSAPFTSVGTTQQFNFINVESPYSIAAERRQRSATLGSAEYPTISSDGSGLNRDEDILPSRDHDEAHHRLRTQEHGEENEGVEGEVGMEEGERAEGADRPFFIPPSNRGRRRSPLWSHFIFVNNKYSCQYCKSIYAGTFSASVTTRTLKKHLTSFHPNILNPSLNDPNTEPRERREFFFVEQNPSGIETIDNYAAHHGTGDLANGATESESVRSGDAVNNIMEEPNDGNEPAEDQEVAEEGSLQNPSSVAASDAPDGEPTEEGVNGEEEGEVDGDGDELEMTNENFPVED